MALSEYRTKRNFKRTTEPDGRTTPSAPSGRTFVVQKHAASHLHYDFRLEQDGVMLSWAIPKGPSLDPADKRLAVQVEDHPLAYSAFEGTIPKGEYGGGTVMLWDRGTWSPDGNAKSGYRNGNFKFTLHGARLRGRWVLVRTHGGKYGGSSKKPAWLLIKERDEFADTHGTAIVDRACTSVASGRSMQAIARSSKAVWHSNRSAAANVRAGAIPSMLPEKSKSASPDAVATGSTRKASARTFVAPALATLVKEAPDGNDWINEIKYDGYRMVCRIRAGTARLFSRNGKDWTRVFAAIAQDLSRLPVRDAWIDGEVVVLDAQGRSEFQSLQNAIGGQSDAALTFFVFDVMYRDGYDLRDAPLFERKRVLHELFDQRSGVVRLGPEVRGGGREFFAQACQLHLEGIISKRADSPYAEGKRTRNWLKIKCMQRQELVIGGYTEPQGSRIGFGALLLGYYDQGDLHYAGKVGTGFDDRLLKSLLAQLTRRKSTQSPFVDPPRGFAAKGVHWVKPQLVAEVEFAEWSADGALRHPSFKGIRQDKKAKEVVREIEAVPRSPVPSASRRARAPDGPATSAPQRAKTKDHTSGLTHPDKLYFPEAKLSKQDLANYYAQVGAQLLPHLKERPLSLVRCPDGWSAECFYQKHASAAVDAAVQRIPVPEGGRTATYLGVNTVEGLVGLVQWGVIELHPWGSSRPRLDRPNRLIFDFDPDEKLAWGDLVTGTKLLRTLLDELGLAGFLKTTGGKGLHVVVPIRPTLTWDGAKEFTKSVAGFLSRTFPDRFTATMSKDRRKGKIFIDYLRNAEGATAIAPYAVRARARAPVSMPIDWKELGREDLRFDHFNITNATKRIARHGTGDWSGFFEVRQSITTTMRQRFN